MASITRTMPLRLRPICSRLAGRACSPIPRWSPPSNTIRAFSVSRQVQAKKYTKDHEWIELSPDSKSGVIGISEYAAHALGDVVYVELPSTDMEVTVGDAIGAVESVKSASDINAPVSCKITAVNELLEEKPATINKGPEDTGSSGGWFAKVEVEELGVKEMLNLMDGEAYKKFTTEE